MDSPNPVTRLKMKIGDHVFEAEGSADSVREQFQVWQELVKLAAIAPPTKQEVPNETKETTTTNGSRTETQTPASIDSGLTRIMRVEDRVVSLTARLDSIHDAVLVMLYGQRTLRNNEAVTGNELISGLQATGGFSFSRLDRILDKLAADGDVMAYGERRGKKYRLTNTGIAKSRQLASELLTTVG